MDIIGDRYKIQAPFVDRRRGITTNAVDLQSGALVTLKLDPERDPQKSLLMREAKVIKLLADVAGVPQIYGRGVTATHNYLALEHLDFTLEELHQRKDLGATDVLTRAEQVLTILECIHKKGFVHQDVRPKNVMTKGPNTYLIDFCLATEIKPERSGHTRRGGLLGSPCFASLSALMGKYQFPKDDIEALGYSIVWLLKGSLPWASNESEDNLLELESKKLSCSVRHICQDCPDELVYYFNYIRGLSDKDTPNYEFLRGLLSFACQGRSQSKEPVALSISERRLQPRQRVMVDDLPSSMSSFLSVSSIPGLEMTQRSEPPDFIEEPELGMEGSSKKGNLESIICSIGDLRSPLGLDEVDSPLKPTPPSKHTTNDLNANSPLVKSPPRKIPHIGKLEEARRSSKRLITIVEVKEAVVKRLRIADEITQRESFDLVLTPQHRLVQEKLCEVSTEPTDSPPVISQRLKRQMREMRQRSPENRSCLIA
jgi:casein kinase 1